MSGSRLDIKLVDLGLATSRERAKEYVLSGSVFVNGEIAKKASQNVFNEDKIEINGETLKYVGRGGLKIEEAIKSFSLDLVGKVCVDLGASTGGFTDCMLQNGASLVFAIDVGHNQLAKKLLDDKRVVNMEGINVKDLVLDSLSEKPSFAASDLSFISCKFAIDAMSRILSTGDKGVILIKPQFEAGKKNLSKGGIVKDKKVHINVLQDICLYASSKGFIVEGLIPSPIKGGDGNVEYLCILVKSNDFTQKLFNYNEIVLKAFS